MCGDRRLANHTQDYTDEVGGHAESAAAARIEKHKTQTGGG